MFLKDNRRIATLIFCGLYVGRPAESTGRLIFEALARLRLIPAVNGQPSADDGALW